jgi:hypothetical protein
MLRRFCLFALFASSACAGPPEVADHPTWADVEPILRGQCNHCHGSSAAVTGSTASLPGGAGSTVYRFDFFDINDGACGEATAAIGPASASAAAPLMRESVASINGNRPRMPPAPAPLLEQWERETIDRWTRTSPIAKGSLPWTNRMPRLQIYEFPQTADQQIRFTAIASDPDGDPVVGIIKAPDGSVVNLDRSGAFSVSIDSSAWPAGKASLTAVLCDGWGHTDFNVGEIEVAHASH